MTSRQSVLRTRSRTLQAIRRFFTDRDFLEVETPVRLPAPALETHIDAIPSDGRYLRTSPELHMKRLLAAGETKVFQMGPCFRRGETGRLHNPEFTMLEWYRADSDYLDILVDTKALLGFVASEVTGSTTVRFGGTRIDLLPVWDRLTVEEAFVMYAGWSPVAAFDPDRFDLDLVEKVEPRLAADKPTVLMDYPAAAGALARRKPGRPDLAERWEVYAGGMELANAFSELTDADEQRKRFGIAAAERQALNREVYPVDERFMEALEAGMPASGGVALGVDRLVMLLADAPSIEAVRPFCRED